MWSGKKILLGISGGIAAYKIPLLIRLLKKEGAEVKVAVTQNALQFVTPLTLETLSQNKIYANVFETAGEYSTEHISLTDWADLFIIAPATANSIGKFANGIADDALSTSFFAFNKDVFVCPAMNPKMYSHFSNCRNIQFLKENGIHFIEPSEGFLACGYEGKGRMEEPENILKQIEDFYTASEQLPLQGKKILVTAGPTYEKIDAVRFVGNYSSGLMGFSLAEELAAQGAEVILVSGPTSLQAKHPNIDRISVESAAEMYKACAKHFPKCNAGIFSAAVADFTPKEVSSQKIKKSKHAWNLELIPTVDILSEMGKQKKSGQILVGFALETDNEIDNAKEKLQKKNLDFIVLNSLNDKGSGFKHCTNKITILDKQGNTDVFPLKEKTDVAKDIVNKLKILFNK